ncbi:hypothetical protein FCX28_25850 [Escherichia coli]|nr:hypothetical protein [Escherichia coli]
MFKYFMQTSRVNGLTSGVFAFLVPASCLNQKGSDTRRDNTTFPVADYYLHFPFFTTEARRRHSSQYVCFLFTSIFNPLPTFPSS